MARSLIEECHLDCVMLQQPSKDMMAIFSDLVEEIMDVFMDDFSVYGGSFEGCLENLEQVLTRCEDTNLVLNWEKCHFMVEEGIILGYKILA